MNLQTFDFKNEPVRVVQRGDAPWFVAVDVCNEMMRETVGYNEQPECGKWLDSIVDSAAELGSAFLE